MSLQALIDPGGLHVLAVGWRPLTRTKLSFQKAAREDFWSRGGCLCASGTACSSSFRIGGVEPGVSWSLSGRAGVCVPGAPPQLVSPGTWPRTTEVLVCRNPSTPYSSAQKQPFLFCNLTRASKPLRKTQVFCGMLQAGRGKG